jgi:hypothetical protein
MIDPVFIRVCAGSWLICSVHMERTMQTSSATLPMCGNSSQISWPDLPNFWNRTAGRSRPARLLQLRDLLALGEGFGHRLAVHLGELGFVVEGFEMRGAAGLVEEDHALRLGGMVQRVTTPRPAASAAKAGLEQRVQREQPEAGYP